MKLVYCILFLIICINSIEAKKCYTLTLCDAEKIALENNPQIRATAELLTAAKEGRYDALSKMMPQLNMWNQTYRTQFDQQPLLDSRMSYITQFTLTQSIIALDKFYNLKLAEVYVQQICLLEQAAYNDTLFRVRKAYYQIILDKKNIATARENIRLLTQLATQVQGLYDIGQAIIYSVNQSKVAVANAMSAYYQAIRNLKVDRDRLILVLGFDPLCVSVEVAEEDIPLNRVPLLSSKIHDLDDLFAGKGNEDWIFQKGFVRLEEERMNALFSCQEIVSWEKVGDEKRPDIRLGKNYLWKAKEKVHLEQSDYYPDLDLIGNYGGEPAPLADYPKNSFFHQSFSWGVGLQLNWLLFDSFGREARVSEARAEERAICYNFKQTVENAHADVREQIFDIEEAVASFTTARSNVLLGEELVEQAKAQLQIGYITVFDYQISVNALIDARNIRDIASFNLITAYYALRHATGIDLR